MELLDFYGNREAAKRAGGGSNATRHALSGQDPLSSLERRATQHPAGRPEEARARQIQIYSNAPLAAQHSFNAAKSTDTFSRRRYRIIERLAVGNRPRNPFLVVRRLCVEIRQADIAFLRLKTPHSKGDSARA